MDNVFADLDVFGVRVLTSGLGANNIAVTVLEKGLDGQIIKKHVLEGELSRIQELLFAYVTNSGADSVSVINTATNTILTSIPVPGGSSPFRIAITPDGTRAYVTNEVNNTVTVIDTLTNTIITTIPLPAGSSPIGIAISPDGSRAYVANFGRNSVTVLDTAINAIIATLPAGNIPRGMAITPILLF